MQIRIFPENSFHVTAGKTAQIKNRPAQVSNSVFGAQCKVTISKEGRRLSEQSQTQTARSAQSIKAEKIMMRQQEEAAQAGSIRDEYMAQLGELDKEIVSMNRSFPSGGDDEAALKKRQVLETMRKQIQTQLEENRKKQEEAQQMAKQSFDTQDEIDRKNRDLLIMLKSIEESEKEEEEEQESGSGEAEGSGDGQADTENSVSDVIQNAATQFGVSSAERELNVVGMIEGLSEDGHSYLDKANEITKGILKDSQSLREFLDDESYTDDEKADAMMRHQRKVMSAYSEVYWDRLRGLKMIRDAKECKVQHIADNPLQGVDETRESMMLSAADAAIGEASQGKLDESSKELKDEVEALIDELNDVTHVESGIKEKEEEEQKEVGELHGASHSGQEQEKEQEQK